MYSINEHNNKIETEMKLANNDYTVCSKIHAHTFFNLYHEGVGFLENSNSMDNQHVTDFKIALSKIQ